MTAAAEPRPQLDRVWLLGVSGVLADTSFSRTLHERIGLPLARLCARDTDSLLG